MMKTTFPRGRGRWLRAGLWLIAAAGASLGAAAQTVVKVEPPDWPLARRPTAVQLLVTGENLAGARLVSATKGVTAGAVEVSSDGRYAFCEVTVTPTAKPGPVKLVLATPQGQAPAPWALFAPLPRSAAFRGLTPDDVVYLLMIDRFANGDPANDSPPGMPPADRGKSKAYHGGDLRGVMDKLDYLQALGVTAIWMTPVYDNADDAEDYHGYGATDFYAVEQRFGTLADYQALAAEIRRRGMKLLQDVIPNHAGPRHPWVRRPPTPTWFHGTPERHLTCNFDIPTLTRPDATPEARALVLEGWFAGILPDLNGADEKYKRYAIQNSLWWAEKAGLDGMRLDTYPYVVRSFWRDWQRAMDAAFPRFAAVGEVWHGDPAVIAFFRGGKTGWDGIDTGLRSQFDFPLFYAIRDFAGGDAPAARLAELLQRDALYGDARMNVTFVGNHDVPRIRRAVGGDLRRVKLALALLMTLRGVPQLYAGDEIGMDGGEDPDNRRDFPGGFGDAPDAFTPAGRAADQQGVWLETQRLIALRRQRRALRRGGHRDVVVQGKQWAFIRDHGKERLLVVVNGDDAPAEVDVPLKALLSPPTRRRRWSPELLHSSSPGLASLAVAGTVARAPVEALGYRVFRLP
ncbi:MAG: alpha-amylase [Chloracidobacterium sp. CP2_5A]|nr:MAG: alpha-amylase [Chloracidobacterium sp. CP2_5A]